MIENVRFYFKKYADIVEFFVFLIIFIAISVGAIYIRHTMFPAHAHSGVPIALRVDPASRDIAAKVWIDSTPHDGVGVNMPNNSSEATNPLGYYLNKHLVFALIATCILGVVLFFIRLWFRIAYGSLEIITGIGASALLFNQNPTGMDSLEPHLYFTVLTAGVYLIVRGLDNLHIGIASRTKNELTRIIEKRKGEVNVVTKVKHKPNRG